VATYSLPLDVIRNENEVVIRASVSGLDPKDIEVTVDDSVVTISGSTESDRAEESNGYVL
jgi:HSP20 family protein